MGSGVAAGAQPRPKTGLASALMLLTTFFWAGNIVAGKMALAGFSPLALAQLRMGAAAILYGALFIAWHGFPSLHLTRRQWLSLILMGLTGITLNQICYIGGLARTSVTHTGLIQAAGPVIVLLLAGMMKLETLTLGKILGMAISFLGVAVLLVEKPPHGSGAHWQGDLILLAASGFFAYYTILMKEVANVYDTLTLNTLVFGVGAVLLIPFCARPVSEVNWRRVPPHAWWGLAFMVLFASLIAYLIYGFALQELSASFVAAFSYLQPIMAAALGVWLLGEKISGGAVLGGILILLGVYLTEAKRTEKKHIRHLASGKV
ncbi:MAG: DMT family transporter [Terriglobia bacterium]